MNNRNIEWKKAKLEQMRKKIEMGQLNALRELLRDDVIKQICEECEYDFRTRLLTPLTTILHMINAGIIREASFQSAWQMSGQTGRSGRLAEARKRLPLDIWIRLHEWMMKEIQKEKASEQLWRGHRVIGIDGTCVSMSDEQELVEHFGRWNSKHDLGRFPIARVVVAFNLTTLINIGHDTGSYKTSEKMLSQRLIKRLWPGDVIVFDRLYSGANLYVEYERAKINYMGRVHASLKIKNLKVIEVLGDKDLLVEMNTDAVCRQQDPTLPKKIQVRVIQTTAKIDGKRQEFWIATNLADTVKYPKQEIIEWQKKRWKVETLIEEMKIWLGADVLRSKTTEGIYKELYARIIGLNLIHWLILKAAEKHNEKIDRLSVSAALRLSTSYSLKMSTAPAWQLPILYDELFERITISKVPYRPNRLEPRTKKRRSRKYPRLKMSRTQWRQMHCMAA
jgi:hypothetical protein